ncbi:KR domain protein [Fusobacterium necrophorum subsp. funduliforme ATCC 51357]|uniref:NAD(P)-dependent oxidoreductase n=1 Tax=Fusobacterium necrophorum subsp. funduliforme TaxID=143387 RepID=A0A162IN02_9FUSO|nr:SDR family NAD(P)-dependent oxidoreductase [Fusobacterium necrophorum]AYV92847.1 SDR family NAD(P)-dependent oxidoreductase [Fusobacterium necrophorum subsp. funduliforme]EIJ72638.1 KR domain protein [Fusobacterium necrophorum subsp. funduliforme ATCC 51357]KAB0552484.1 SDR family NAD(P)-dependent oxidoreductase [Fusobacterium necrophorum subsp. funduliforme]KYL02806.1 NAD(P)-dependent oxidoreductase [Fusobacterium necrophorum subsp. funduliforme]KYM42367.1 NAD(P)-dependent oxidoreductase [
MNCENRLQGKIAFITGATSGIGKATAIALAKEGVDLILTARREQLLLELKSHLEQTYNIRVFTLRFDVRDSQTVKRSIEMLPLSWRNIQILVNNAGLALGLDKEYMNTSEDIDTVIDTNVKGMLYVTNAVVPLMLSHRKPSIIVNLGSVAGDSAYAGGAVYCASKAAIKILSDGLRIDLIDSPIKITNVKPGVVETNFSNIRFKGDEERAKKVYTGIQSLTPENIADTIVYICNLPDNVQIPEITMTPMMQADGLHIYRHSNENTF